MCWSLKKRMTQTAVVGKGTPDGYTGWAKGMRRGWGLEFCRGAGVPGSGGKNPKRNRDKGPTEAEAVFRAWWQWNPML